MTRADVEAAVKEFRPGSPVRWENGVLLAESFVDGFVSYSPRLALSFLKFADRDTEFDGFTFRTSFARERGSDLRLVNELNANARFVRHHTTDRAHIIESDIVISDVELTDRSFQTHYFLFQMAVEQLDTVLSTPANEVN